RQSSPVDGIVTLHDLAHQPPRKAEREFKRAWAARDKGNLDVAIMSFHKAIALDPKYCAALNDLGITYLQTDQVDLAIEQFNKIIAIDPHSSSAYSNLAIGSLRKEQFTDGERLARRALALDRTSTHGQLALGVSLILQKQFTPEMERSLTKAAAGFPQADFWLAIGLLHKGERESAKDHLKVYLASSEKDCIESARSLLQQLELNADSKQ
ncbi:MAG TPA: tetratricopeptide repeat protein, partial [Bryobacteraceae bacterium]|nr:tetratricopeptide repeat protein [Bryobacteraceae bacterium]